MGVLPPLIAELRLQSGEFTKKLGEAKAEMDKTAKEGGGAFQKLSSVGKGLLIGVAGAAVGVGTASIEMAEKFQTSTATLAGNADISTAAAAKIGQAFLNTGFHSTFSANEIMAAFAPVGGEFVRMYGHALNSKQALTVMTAAMNDAEASGAPLADTTKALADAVQVFHLNVGQASSASDAMFNTSRLLGVSVTDLGTSLSRLEPRIAGSGMSLQQTGAFMLQLAQSAGSGRQAMRVAGTAIQGLISPSTAAQKALDTMGISLTDANGKFVGMPQAIGLLHNAFAKLPGAQGAVAAGEQLVAAQTQLAQMKTENQSKSLKASETALTQHIGALKLQAGQLSQNTAMTAIFGRQAGIMTDMVAGGVPAFNAAATSVAQVGTAQRAADLHAKTFHGSLKTLESGVEDVGIKLGLVLIPMLTKVIDAVSSATTWFMKHKAVAIAVAAVIGGVMVVAIGAYVAGLVNAAAENISSFATMVSGWFGVGAAAEATEATTVAATEGIGAAEEGLAATSEAVGPEIDAGLGPIGIVIGVIMIAITLLHSHWKQIWGAIKAIALDVWHVLSPVFHAVGRALHDYIQVYITVLGDIWKVIWAGIHATVTVAWSILRPVFEAVKAGIRTSIVDEIQALKRAWDDVWSGIKLAVASAWSVLKPIFDKIGQAVGAVTGGISKVIGAISGAGQAIGGAVGSVGKLFGFAQGGVVPGPRGAPMLAVVHGGEMVIPTTAMTDTKAGQPLPTAITGSSGGSSVTMGGTGTAGGGGGSMNLAQNVSLQLDGRVIWQTVRKFALADLASGRLPGTGMVA